MIQDSNKEGRKEAEDTQFKAQIKGEKKEEFMKILTKSISYWLRKDNNPEQYIKEMLEYCENDYEKHRYPLEFIDLKAIELIYISNKLEGTIPTGACQQRTYKLLQDFLKNPYSVKIESWPADCHKEGQVNESQITQHLLAYKYLCSKESLENPLTVDKIKKSHELLLKESVDENDQKVLCGSYRVQNAFAGNHQYPKPECIGKQMERIVDEFNNSSDHFLLRAAKLFYETISLHPFIDGNGRLCRLLIAYALMKNGVPFAVPLFASKKSQKRYIDAIIRKRNKNDYSFLLQMILYSLYCTRKSYEDNCKYKFDD